MFGLRPTPTRIASASSRSPAGVRTTAVLDARRLDAHPQVDALGTQDSTRRSTSAGSSRGSIRSPCCRTVTSTPSRRKPCASSMAIGPPPRQTSDRGGALELPHRLAGQVARLLQAGDRRGDGPRAGREQDEPRGDPLAADLDDVAARRGARSRADRLMPSSSLNRSGESSVAATCAAPPRMRSNTFARVDPRLDRLDAEVRLRCACGARPSRWPAAPSTGRTRSTGSPRRRDRARPPRP